MEKYEYTYEDLKDFIVGYYDRAIRLDDETIAKVNDYITNEELGRWNFDNKMKEFLNCLPMCTFMAEHNLMDKFFFDKVIEFKPLYLNGEFDDYFFDKEKDKKDIDKDLSLIEEYLKKYNTQK